MVACVKLGSAAPGVEPEQLEWESSVLPFDHLLPHVSMREIIWNMGFGPIWFYRITIPIIIIKVDNGR